MQVPTEIIQRKKEEKSLKRKLPVDSSVKKHQKRIDLDSEQEEKDGKEIRKWSESFKNNK